MRKVMLFLAVFGLVGSLWAADPVVQTEKSKNVADVGSWKLNVAKSKIPPAAEAAIKELNVVVRELDADFEYTETGTRMDGSAISTKWTVPKQGGVFKYQQGGAADKTTTIRTVIFLDPGDWYDTDLQNGKQTQVRHVVVSKDGKTMRQVAKGTDAKGKPYEEIVLYDRQ